MQNRNTLMRFSILAEINYSLNLFLIKYHQVHVCIMIDEFSGARLQKWFPRCKKEETRDRKPQWNGETCPFHSRRGHFSLCTCCEMVLTAPWEIDLLNGGSVNNIRLLTLARLGPSAQLIYGYFIVSSVTRITQIQFSPKMLIICIGTVILCNMKT